jgi:hypothetical protein
LRECQKPTFNRLFAKKAIPAACPGRILVARSYSKGNNTALLSEIQATVLDSALPNRVKISVGVSSTGYLF